MSWGTYARHYEQRTHFTLLKYGYNYTQTYQVVKEANCIPKQS